MSVADADDGVLSHSVSLLATCSADQTCKIWRTSNFSLMTELSIKSNNPGETSRGWMWDCAFSGDSQYIVTGRPSLVILAVKAPIIRIIMNCVVFWFFSPQLPRTTWLVCGVWRRARSKGSTVAIRRPWCVWPSMTAC